MGFTYGASETYRDDTEGAAILSDVVHPAFAPASDGKFQDFGVDCLA